MRHYALPAALFTVAAAILYASAPSARADDSATAAPAPAMWCHRVSNADAGTMEQWGDAQLAAGRSHFITVDPARLVCAW